MTYALYILMDEQLKQVHYTLLDNLGPRVVNGQAQPTLYEEQTHVWFAGVRLAEVKAILLDKNPKEVHVNVKIIDADGHRVEEFDPLSNGLVMALAKGLPTLFKKKVDSPTNPTGTT